MSDYLDPNNEELLKDFFMEANGQVEILEQNILAIEDNPDDRDSVDEIFRAAHTLKGGAATVQMMELSSFTHIVEDLLDEIRSDNIKITEDVVDNLLASIDVIKEMLSARHNGEVYEEDISQLKNALEVLSRGGGGSSVSRPASSSVAAESAMPSLFSGASSLSEYDILELQEAAGGDPVVQVKVEFDEENPMNSVGGIQVYAKLKTLGMLLKTLPDFEQLYEDRFFPEVRYFLVTTVNPEEIEEEGFIPDVTKSVDASFLSVTEEALSAEQDAASVEEQALPSREEPSQDENDVLTGQELPEPQDTAEKEPPVSSPESKKKKNPALGKSKARDAVSSVLRVDSKRIDNLLNLVSEAVINKATFNQINNAFMDIQNTFQSADALFKETLKNLFDDLPQYLKDIHDNRSVRDVKAQMLEKYEGLFTTFDSFNDEFKKTLSTFKSTAANLGRNTGDLHEAILRIRMVPISQIFSRFPRLVRDLSKSLNKKIELTIEGEDTELDKSVIQELLDPLMHCVRNSMDHGIESPEQRAAMGKSEEGHILLKASNEGNIIVIEIADDGAGIDVEGIKRKAIERGVIHPGKNLSDVEAYNLIFAPGFSTAREITNISGRGVGLDVVRKEIEKLNGTVSVDSSPGKGTRFTIKLPLTLAIIQGLLVKVGTEIYAIPITSVLESLRIKPEEIQIIDNHEVFNIREDVISLVRLNRLFRIEEQESQDYNFIVIVGSGDKKMGIMVDSLVGEEDVVIKPLKDRYTNSPGIAGATILGDGTVSLIMDVSQLLDLCIQKEQTFRQQRSRVY